MSGPCTFASRPYDPSRLDPLPPQHLCGSGLPVACGMAMRILHTVLCGWANSEIATLIQAVRPGKTARKRKALLLEEVGALCQEPAAHRRLCELVLAKHSAEYLRLVLRSSGGVRVASLNRKQCLGELIRLDRGSGASSSAASRTAPSAPAEGLPQQIVQVDHKARKGLRKRLHRRFMRHAVSNKIKAVLKARDWSGYVLSDIRRAVADKVGISLETGSCRVFFERQLQRTLLAGVRKRRRTRATPKSSSTGRVPPDEQIDEELGGPHRRHREHTSMRYNDYTSRLAFR